jgi:hypothetical protein
MRFRHGPSALRQPVYRELKSPSPSHHQFELNHHSILFVDWDMLRTRNWRPDID